MWAMYQEHPVLLCSATGVKQVILTDGPEVFWVIGTVGWLKCQA